MSRRPRSACCARRAPADPHRPRRSREDAPRPGRRAAAAAAFPDGVWFVDLAPLADAGLVVPTIAHAVGAYQAADRPVPDILRERLRDQRALLLLDNCEHVLAAVPSVAELLESGPDVRVLATSRTALRSRWEHVYAVPPLAVADLPPGVAPGSVVAAVAAAPAVAPVRPARPGGRARVRPGRGQRGRRRRAVRPAGRATARHRAGGGPLHGARAGGDPGPAPRPARAAHRRSVGPSRAPPHAPRGDRVERRAPGAVRADPVPPPGRVRRRVHAGGGRGGRGPRGADRPRRRAVPCACAPSGGPSGRRGAGRPGVAGGEEPHPARCPARRPAPVPHAGDDRRVRAGGAGRQRGDGGGAPAPRGVLPLAGRAGRGRPGGAGAARLARPAGGGARQPARRPALGAGSRRGRAWPAARRGAGVVLVGARAT